jgi:hypothetical protein
MPALAWGILHEPSVSGNLADTASKTYLLSLKIAKDLEMA